MVSQHYRNSELTLTAILSPDSPAVCEFRTSDLPEYSLSPALKAQLLSLSSPQLMSIAFFREVKMTVTGHIRVENKKRFYRVSVNKGDAVFEVPIGTIRVARMACALKAIKQFCPTLVAEWLHRNRKVGNVVKEFLEEQ